MNIRHLNTGKAKVCVQILAVPVNDIDNSVILRLSFLQLVDPRSEIFLNLHPLRQTKRQLVVLELQGLQVQLILQFKNRKIDEPSLKHVMKSNQKKRI